MRIFAGSKTSEFGPPPPKLFVQDDSSSMGSTSPKSSQSSLGHTFSSPKIRSNSSSPHLSSLTPQEQSSMDNVPPEMVPIVTLLSAHAHRRYCEGVFLILEDLRNDGNPGARKWQEVYGMLVGTQLALWDANELGACNRAELKYKLKEVVSKPRYINFTDAAVKLLDGSEAIVTESNRKLDNVAVVSTTLKNRHFLQFSNREAFIRWNAAIQLSIFECTSLQEAYTGAFLSSRGAQLGDIKTLLDSKFNYEGWGSVRFGTGMPWKRCFIIVTQSTGRKKGTLGQIGFFENEKKTKKSQAIATVVSCKRLYAVYPSSPQLIDSSTIIKLEGSMKFNKKDNPQGTSFFVMPEKHQAVPGYDTTIRFLVPAMNAFRLYGRPSKLAANKEDPKSLLFGLPVLPHVHYLKVEELLPLSSSPTSVSWTFHDWSDNIKKILLDKMSNGYTGCGSSSGVMGAMASPTVGTTQAFSGPLPLIPKPRPERAEKKNTATISPDYSTVRSRTIEDSMMPDKPSNSNNLLQVRNKTKGDSETTISVYSGDEDPKLGNENPKERTKKWNTSEFEQPTAKDDEEFDQTRHPARNSTRIPYEALKNPYQNNSMSPFDQTKGPNISREHQFINPYISHGSDKRGIDKKADDDTNKNKENGLSTSGDYASSDEERDEEQDALREFNDLAKRINELNIEAAPGPERKVPKGKVSPWDTESSSAGNRNVTDDDDNDNVFDPDFMEQSGMLEAHSRHTGNKSFSDNSEEDPFNGISSRGLEIITPPHKSTEPETNLQINNNMHTEASVPLGGVANPYRQGPRTGPVANPPYNQSRSLPNNHPHRPMVRQAGGFPPHNFSSHNFPPPSSHHKQHHHGHPYRSHRYGPPQPYPMNAPHNRNYMNAYPPQQRMHPGAMGPHPQMHIYGGRAGPYPPPGQHQRRQAPVGLKQPPVGLKQPMRGGHSKFIPPTMVNPYAQ